MVTAEIPLPDYVAKRLRIGDEVKLAFLNPNNALDDFVVGAQVKALIVKDRDFFDLTPNITRVHLHIEEELYSTGRNH